MLKLITSAIVAGSFALTGAQHASACGGGVCGGRRACAPAPAPACDAQPAAPAAPAASPETPDMPPTPPSTAQGAPRQYRSYSYDAAPAYRAPAARSYNRPNSWQQYQFRADRKMRGL